MTLRIGSSTSGSKRVAVSATRRSTSTSRLDATAPALAQHLSRNAGVLDAVIGGDFFAPWPGTAALAEAATAAMAGVSDYERKLDALRRWRKEWHFRIGVHHLRGLIEAAEAAVELSERTGKPILVATELAVAEDLRQRVLERAVATVDHQQFNPFIGEVAQGFGNTVRLESLAMHDVRRFGQKSGHRSPPFLVAAAAWVGQHPNFQALPMTGVILGSLRISLERAAHNNSGLGTTAKPSLHECKRFVRRVDIKEPGAQWPGCDPGL